MGTYTDFFVADPEELRRAFVGWRRPAPTREKRAILNPFTRQFQDVLTWVADPGDNEQVEPFAGATLGERLSRFPLLDMKNFDPLMLSELVAVVMGGAPNEWLDRIGNPPPLAPLVNAGDPANEHRAFIFWELPESFVDALASFGPGESAEVGGRWAACSETDWSVEDCAAVVCDLSALAKKARAAGKRVYYWV